MAGRNQRRRRREMQSGDPAGSVITAAGRLTGLAAVLEEMGQPVAFGGVASREGQVSTAMGATPQESIIDEPRRWVPSENPAFDAAADVYGPPYSSDLHWAWRGWGMTRPEFAAIAATAPVPPAGIHDVTTVMPVINDRAAALTEPTAAYDVLGGTR